MDGTYPRRALPTYQAPSLDDFVRSGFARPGEIGWTQLTDVHVIVGGLNATARRHIIRQLLYHIDETIAKQPTRRDQFDVLLGTLEACHIVRYLLKGGKWTWDAKRHRRRTNLLDIVADLAYPPRLPKRSTPDRVALARRQAFEGLYNFTIDVPCSQLPSLLDGTLPISNIRTQDTGQAISRRELQRRIGQVIHFYGAGRPVRIMDTRYWRLYPWRLWLIDHEFEQYGDVCLDVLQWLPASHFQPHLESSLAYWRKIYSTR